MARGLFKFAKIVFSIIYFCDYHFLAEKCCSKILTSLYPTNNPVSNHWKVLVNYEQKGPLLLFISPSEVDYFENVR